MKCGPTTVPVVRATRRRRPAHRTDHRRARHLAGMGRRSDGHLVAVDTLAEARSTQPLAIVAMRWAAANHIEIRRPVPVIGRQTIGIEIDL